MHDFIARLPTYMSNLRYFMSNSLIHSMHFIYKEPSRLKTKKEPSKGSFINGGNDEARTRDLMRDRHAL